MKITVDANVLVRAVMHDDPRQGRAADKALKQATLIAVSLPCLCEFAWVLRRVYGLADPAIAIAIRALLDAANVVTNRPAVEAGLVILEAGGDFADGVMAYEGAWMGADTFVSFDKQAVALLSKQGQAARLLS